MRRCAIFLCAWLAAGALSAHANDTPTAIVAAIVGALDASRKAAQEALSGDHAIATAQEIIQRDVAPHMDFGRITSQAVGQPWSGAGASQRADLEREFRQLLVHVLARLLVLNHTDILETLPMTVAPQGNLAVVRVGVTRQRAAGNYASEPMQVTLRYHDGAWKILELHTDGVDVVKLYSANFAVVIERNGGIDGLVRALAERNARNAQAAIARPAPPPRALGEDACLACSGP